MVACWWCCHLIEDKILNLPYKYNRLTDNFETKGYFCSWECMKAWNLGYGGKNKGDIAQLVTLLKYKITGTIKKIQKAPSRYCLKMFGGNIDIVDFRKGLNNFWVNLHNINFQPLIVHKYSEISNVDYRENEIETIINSKDKMNDINNSDGGELVLKRPIPLKKNKNDLADMMGLKKRTKE